MRRLLSSQLITSLKWQADRCSPSLACTPSNPERAVLASLMIDKNSKAQRVLMAAEGLYCMWHYMRVFNCHYSPPSSLNLLAMSLCLQPGAREQRRISSRLERKLLMWWKWILSCSQCKKTSKKTHTWPYDHIHEFCLWFIKLQTQGTERNELLWIV